MVVGGWYELSEIGSGLPSLVLGRSSFTASETAGSVTGEGTSFFGSGVIGSPGSAMHGWQFVVVVTAGG